MHPALEHAGPKPAESRASQPSRPSCWLMRSIVSLISIGLLAWIGLSWAQYRTNRRNLGSWQTGEFYRVEVTIVPQDRENLACASSLQVEGLRCGYDAPSSQADVLEANTLRPYSAVTGEVFLGAGLWSDLPAPPDLPRSRFTATCLFQVISAAKPWLRWTDDGAFQQATKGLPVGRLTDCIILR